MIVHKYILVPQYITDNLCNLNLKYTILFSKSYLNYLTNMKIKFYSFIVFLMFLLGACQSSIGIDDVQETSDKNLVFNSSKIDDDLISSDVVLRLKAYNDSLYNCVAETSSINGNSLRLHRILKISIRDFLGRVEGASYGITIGSLGGPEGIAIGVAILAPLVGAFRSYEAAFPIQIKSDEAYDIFISSFLKMREDCSDYSLHYPMEIILQLPEDKKCLQIDGAQHNLILDNLIKHNYSNATLDEAFAKKLITRKEYKIFRTKEIKQLFKDITNSRWCDYENYYDSEQLNSIVKLYKEAIQDFSNSYSDVENISNRYVSEILSTKELEENQKDELVSSISVLVSSVEYWKGFDTESTE